MPDTQRERVFKVRQAHARGFCARRTAARPYDLKCLDYDRIDPLQSPQIEGWTKSDALKRRPEKYSCLFSRGAGKMTLEDALAVYLYLQVVDTIEEREERIRDAAWKIIEQQARKAIGSFPENGSDQPSKTTPITATDNG